MGSRSLPLGVIVVIILGIIFSIEMPIEGLGSKYASINSEDIVVLAVTIMTVYSLSQEGWRLRLQLPRLTSLLFLITGWQVITLAVVIVWGETPLVSSLWLFKWFEGLIFFVFLQHLWNESAAKTTLRTILFGGSAMALFAIVLSLTGTRRVRFFFHNPNTLAMFFVLVIFLGVGYGLREDNWFYFLLSCFGLIGLFTTGSRSGILALITSSIIFTFFAPLKLSRRQIFISGVVGIISLTALPVIAGDLISRILSGVAIRDGTIVFTGKSYVKRIELILTAIDLFKQRPIFGYGWYAVPSRIGYLDNHYTTLLTELGIFGTTIYGLFYAFVLRVFISVRNRGDLILGTVLSSWFIGALVRSVADNSLRAPQVMMLLFLLLVSGIALRENHTETDSIISQ